MTASLGVAAAMPDREGAWQDIELIAAAERALAQAREAGRNTVIAGYTRLDRPLVGTSFAPFRSMFLYFEKELSWTELARRTVKDSIQDDVAGLAAQLAYYFFLSLFPALLFLVALASFFPLYSFTDELMRLLGADRAGRRRRRFCRIS